MKLDDSIAAIVTGGASGPGEAVARALAAQGVGVVIFDLDPAGAEVARQIGAQFLRVDLTCEDSLAIGLMEARGAFGPERLLIHCAGVALPDWLLQESSADIVITRLPPAHSSRWPHPAEY